MTESSARCYFFHILSSKHLHYFCDRSLAKSLLGIKVIFRGLARRAQCGAFLRSSVWAGDLPKLPHCEPDFPIGFTPSPSLKPEAVGLQGWRRKGPRPAAVSARGALGSLAGQPLGLQPWKIFDCQESRVWHFPSYWPLLLGFQQR